MSKGVKLIEKSQERMYIDTMMELEIFDRFHPENLLQRMQLVLHMLDGQEHLLSIYWDNLTCQGILEQYMDEFPFGTLYVIPDKDAPTIKSTFIALGLNNYHVEWLPRPDAEKRDMEDIMNDALDIMDCEIFCLYERSTGYNITG